MSARTSDCSHVARAAEKFISGHREIFLALVLLLFCLFLLFHNLGEPALFEPDEGRNAEIGREILLTEDWVTPDYDFTPRLDKPIFYYWMTALSYKFFGISEWSARLPSVLAAVGCVFLTYWWTKSSFGSWEALWSGLTLVTSAEFFIFSRAVILDMTLTFFITLSLSSFCWATEARSRETRRVWHLLMYGAIAVAILIKGPIGFILPGMVIFFYLLYTKQLSALREMNLLLGLALVLASVAPWYTLVELRNPGYLRYFLFNENFLRFMTPSFGRTEPWYYFFPVLLIGFFPWTLLIAVIFGDLWAGFLDNKTLFLVLWTVVPLLFFSLSTSKLPHYILPVYPPLSILAGKSLSQVSIEPFRRRKPILSLPWLTLAALFVAVLVGTLLPNLVAEHLGARFRQISALLPPFLVLSLFALFIALAAASWRISWKKPEPIYVSYCCGLLFWVIFSQHMAQGISYTRSSKELREKAAALIHPNDQIVIYHAYLSSLPFYMEINRPVWVVWSGQEKKVMGSSYVVQQRPHPAPGYGKIFFTYDEFSAIWKNSKQRLVVFIHERDFSHLKEHSGASPKKLFQLKDIILASNQ